MSLLDRVKKWPVERKRIFSISLAVFLTILVIILNISINQIWKKDIPVTSYKQKEAIKSLQESFSQIFEQIKPTLDQFNSVVASSSNSNEIIDQINATTSSFSTTSNIVE